MLAVSEAIVSHRDLPALFHELAGRLHQVVQFDYLALVLHEAASNTMRLHVLESLRTHPAPALLSFPVEERPGGVGVADPATAHHFQRGRARALAGVPGTSAAVWSPELLLASADHRPAAAGHAGVRVASSRPPTMRRTWASCNSSPTRWPWPSRTPWPSRRSTALKDKLAKEKAYLEEEVRTEHNFGEIVGESAALRRVLKEVETVAPTDSTVLIRGETGTGKELIARALHDLSPRRDRTFVKLNCAAIPTGLLESELFGHEKGAFTGAISQKVGRFELAHQGTLFLDEVGDIPPELQPKLLRVLQEQEFERLGGTKTIKVDVRLVAATNRDLAAMVADGRFRERPLLPPERLPGRAAAAARALGRHPAAGPPFHPAVRPADGPADRDHPVRGHGGPGPLPLAGQRPGAAKRHRTRGHPLPRLVASGPARRLAACGPHRPRRRLPTAVTLADAEREHILGALRETGWVVGGPKGAAARLGMKRSTLYWKMKKLGISRPD